MVMDKAIRKKISWSHLGLALVVGWMLATAPIREVRAAIPLLAAAGALMRTSIGKSLMASLAIHAAVLAVEFHNNAAATPTSGDADKRLEVKLNPKDPLKTPSGWTAPASGQVEPSPPASGVVGGGGTEYKDPGGTSWKATPEAAGLDWFNRLSNAPGAWTFSSCPNANQRTYSVAPASGNYAATLFCNGSYYTDVILSQRAGAITCAAGYTVSGSSCVLSNAAVVVKPADNMSEIKRVGNVFYADARDTADGLPDGVVITPDKVSLVDALGNKWETSIRADGTSDVVETKARTDGSAKTDRTTLALSAPDATTGAVVVTGAKAEVLSGTGILATDGTSATGSSDAKDATLQAIKSSIDAENTKVDTDRTAAETAAAALPGQLSGMAASGQDTVAGLGLPSQSQFTSHDVAGIGNALPSNTGVCVALDVSLPQLGNLHIAPCSVVSAVAPLVDFLIIALGVAGGVFVLLGKREET